MARHLHVGRPRRLYCFKCRLQVEIDYLSCPWIMQKASTDKMMWFDVSDLDSEQDEKNTNVLNEREVSWMREYIDGKVKVKPLRRSAQVR